MSISTNDISDEFFHLGNSGMMNVHSTTQPTSPLTTLFPMLDSTADHCGVPEDWKQEFERKIIFAETKGSDYLCTYVPSVTSYTVTAATGEEFDEYKPAKGREADNYSAFVSRSSSSSEGSSRRPLDCWSKRTCLILPRRETVVVLGLSYHGSAIPVLRLRSRPPRFACWHCCLLPWTNT